METLLKNGSDPNVAVADVMPLHLAVEKGFMAVADLLLAAGADPSLRQKDGMDAFAVACRHERVRLIELLLRKHKLSHSPEEYHPHSVNPYVRAALLGKFEEYYRAASNLVTSVEYSNLKLFNDSRKNFPLNDPIGLEGQSLRPLVFHMLENGFEAGLRLISHNCDILAKDESGTGLGMYLVKNSEPGELFKLIEECFPGKLQTIVSQRKNGCSPV